jgi:BlaI family transcriptional regulator, penicillinase repressor
MAGRRKGTSSPTPLEIQIMQVLWRDGPSSVQHVQENLPAGSNLAYNTVQTMLNVLHRKNRARRTLKGRAYVYRATVTKDTALGQAVRDLVERMFGGSSEELVMSLIKSRQVDPERIAALGRKLVKQKESETDD